MKKEFRVALLAITAFMFYTVSVAQTPTAKKTAHPKPASADTAKKPALKSFQPEKKPFEVQKPKKKG